MTAILFFLLCQSESAPEYFPIEALQQRINPPPGAGCGNVGPEDIMGFSKEAVPLLLAAIQEDVPQRAQMTHALAFYKDSRATVPLMGLIDEERANPVPNQTFLEVAVYTLGCLNDLRASSYLHQVMLDTSLSQRTRLFAAEALAANKESALYPDGQGYIKRVFDEAVTEASGHDPKADWMALCVRALFQLDEPELMARLTQPAAYQYSAKYSIFEWEDGPRPSFEDHIRRINNPELLHILSDLVDMAMAEGFEDLELMNPITLKAARFAARSLAYHGQDTAAYEALENRCRLNLSFLDGLRHRGQISKDQYGAFKAELLINDDCSLSAFNR